MVFVEANPLEWSRISQMGGLHHPKAQLCCLCLCVHLCYQSLFNDAIAVWPYSTYMLPILAPFMRSHEWHLSSAFIKKQSSRMSRLYLLYLCAMFKLHIQSIIYSVYKVCDDDGSVPCRIKPNGNGIVE